MVGDGAAFVDKGGDLRLLIARAQIGALLQGRLFRKARGMAQVVVPNRQRRAQGASGVPGGRLYPDILEKAFAQ